MLKLHTEYHRHDTCTKSSPMFKWKYLFAGSTDTVSVECIYHSEPCYLIWNLKLKYCGLTWLTWFFWNGMWKLVRFFMTKNLLLLNWLSLYDNSHFWDISLVSGKKVRPAFSQMWVNFQYEQKLRVSLDTRQHFIGLIQFCNLEQRFG